MNNTEKLLRAFIEASGYEVEEIVTTSVFGSAEVPTKEEFISGMCGPTIVEAIDYRVTKRIVKGVDMRKEFPNEKI